MPGRYRYTENITGYVITARPQVPQYRTTWEIPVDSGTTRHSLPVPVGSVVDFTVRAEACGEGRESFRIVVRIQGEGYV